MVLHFSLDYPPYDGFTSTDLLALLDGDFHIVADIDFCTRPEFDHAVELAVLQFIAATRLRAGRLTVVDATNVKREDRAKLVALAREHDVLPVAIVLDVPERVCLERNAARPDRDLPAGVVSRQRSELHRGLRGLSREGFRKVHRLTSVEDVEAAVISYEKQYNDRREDAGPFDVIGDVHDCVDELRLLLTKLGWELGEGDRRVDVVEGGDAAGMGLNEAGDLDAFLAFYTEWVAHGRPEEDFQAMARELRGD